MWRWKPGSLQSRTLIALQGRPLTVYPSRTVFKTPSGSHHQLSPKSSFRFWGSTRIIPKSSRVRAGWFFLVRVTAAVAEHQANDWPEQMCSNWHSSVLHCGAPWKAVTRHNDSSNNHKFKKIQKKKPEIHAFFSLLVVAHEIRTLPII